MNFTKEEYKSRLKKVQASMQAKGIEFLISQDPGSLLMPFLVAVIDLVNSSSLKCLDSCIIFNKHRHHKHKHHHHNDVDEILLYNDSYNDSLYTFFFFEFFF